MAVRIQIRRGTAAQWTAANPNLAAGEVGYETDTGRLKVGNGADQWTVLGYYDEQVADEVVASGAVAAAIADEQTVIDAAAAAVDANPTIASLTPATDKVVMGTSTGPVSRRLGFIDVNWFGATSYPDGADYAGGTAYADMVDSSTAINDALAAGKSFNLSVQASGRFRVDSTIAIKSNVDFTNATFVCNDTALTVVRVGSNVAGDWHPYRYLDVRLGAVIQAAKTGTGWSGTSIGIEAANLNRAMLSFRRITGFVTGFRCTAYGTAGFSYNTVTMGHLDNNKVNQQLLTTGTDALGSWVNENLFLGGSCSHDSGEGSAAPGTRHILLTSTGVAQINNNVWVRTSFESPLNPPIVEYTVESIAGRDNRWLQCWWEANPGAKVWWNELGAAQFSQHNTIDGGYASNTIQFTVSANSAGNRVVNSPDSIVQGYGSAGIYKMRNVSGATLPIITFFGREIMNAAATEWNVQFGPSYLRSKPTASANPWFQIQMADGQMSWGGGSAAVDTQLNRGAADRLTMGAGDAFRTGAIDALPAASSAYRGYMYRVEGGAGVADALYICEKNAADAYVWRAI